MSKPTKWALRKAQHLGVPDIPLVALALDAARRAAIEEAAKVADPKHRPRLNKSTGEHGRIADASSKWLLKLVARPLLPSAPSSTRSQNERRVPEGHAMTGRGVISLGARRKPVTYTIRLRQGWDGKLAVWVQDIADDERSRKAAADAMRRAADLIENGE